jgi:4-amino-4-deoxy-L-arabinose transferase-like glycosyltransferase
MQHSRSVQIVLGCLLSLAGPAAVYGLTLAPTVQGFDSAELTVGAATLGLVHPTGYPLYMLVGHAFAQLPWGETGFRLNLLSAVLGTAAVGLIYLLALRQTHSALTALSTAWLFALAPHVWAQSIRAEVYTLQVLLVVGTLLLGYTAWQKDQPARILAAFALLGLAGANHGTSILLLPALLAGIDWKDNRWRKYALAGILLCGGLAGLGTLYFPWRAAQAPAINYIGEYFGRDPRRPADLLWLVTGQAFRCAVQPAWTGQQIWAQLMRLGAFLWDGSLGLAPLLGTWGWLRLNRSQPRWNRLLSIYFLGNLVFFFIYQVVDKEAMFLPMYLVMDLWIAQGMLGFAGWLASRLPRLEQPAALRLTNLALLILLGVGMVVDWRAVDLSQDRQSYNYAAQVLEALPDGTVIVNHWATASVFDYLRIVEGVRPDVRSFNLDFFSLGTQAACHTEDDGGLNAAWFAWLETQVQAHTPLCFIEPLPALPLRFLWVNQGACWTLEFVP